MRRNVVVRSIERADPQIIAALGEAGVATVHEAMGRTGLLGTALTPIQSRARVAGSAVTVSCHPGDNLMIHAAVEQVSAGDVVVVTTTSPSTDGMFDELQDVGLPVWARAVSARGTVKATPGSVNVPVVCAGGLVNPGDVVVADDDGVVIVPRADAGAADEASRARLEREAAARQRLAAGELGLDI